MKFKNPFKNSVTEVAVPFSEINEQWNVFLSSIGISEYSNAILHAVLTPIFDELKKVQFYVLPEFQSKEAEIKNIIDFLNVKYKTIYRYLLERGFVGVKIKENEILFDHEIFVKSVSGYEKILNNPLSAKSFTFEFFGQSQKEILAELIKSINTGLSVQNAVTQILGQFTFFSREKEGNNEVAIKLTDEERKKFETQFNGIFTGKNVGTSIHLTNATLKRDTIIFPLDKLQIKENVVFATMILASVLNVPYDLIPLTGKSTYANQESAIEYLRTNTVNSIAETMLELGQSILRYSGKMIPSRAIDYQIIIDVNKVFDKRPVQQVQPQQ